MSSTTSFKFKLLSLLLLLLDHLLSVLQLLEIDLLGELKVDTFFEKQTWFLKFSCVEVICFFSQFKSGVEFILVVEVVRLLCPLLWDSGERTWESTLEACHLINHHAEFVLKNSDWSLTVSVQVQEVRSFRSVEVGHSFEFSMYICQKKFDVLHVSHLLRRLNSADDRVQVLLSKLLRWCTSLLCELIEFGVS